MRSGISQFVTPVSVTILYLVVIGFNRILAVEYANLKKIEVENRSHHFRNLIEVRERDYPSGHGSLGYSRGTNPSTSQDQYQRPKPDYSALKHQSRPPTSSHSSSKAPNQAPAHKGSYYTPAFFCSPSYTSPVYAPPTYNSVAYSNHFYSSANNKPPASNSPVYSRSVYNSSTYSPPAYNATAQFSSLHSKR